MTASYAIEPHEAADDPAARIAALFDEHCGFVCRVLRHHGVQEAALDDAVQDVFVTAYRRWSTFEGRSSARSWLFGIARRIAFRYRRSADARARRFVVADDEVPEGVHEPFDRLQAAHSLAALLERLDDDKRAVLVLAELEGMTAPEVADALGLPLGTVYSRLRAAWQGLGREAGRETRRELSRLRAPEPSSEQRRRMWGLVAGGLVPGKGGGAAATGGGAAATGGWWAQTKWLVVGSALGVGLLGARAATVAARRPEPPKQVESLADPVDRRVGRDARREAAGEADPVPDVVPAQPRPVPTPGPEPRPVARPLAPPTARPKVEAPMPEADALTAELSLLQRARQALREGQPDVALERLAEHARRFPQGQLTDERQLVRLEALCASGRSDQAALEAKRLGRDPACP